ncbi:hypothetical protein HYDPIDRAFT_112959 [Hydnomerulius pinastri MD-312]|uniref:Uncharacterized protein n=1 Tax=Hydnomerulius pinastri MD-312 TaxID=994086 RepID=A0A0C9WE13_9AGAM|nr:hypothetical protein HYDPIDRAFT_112959 [Hydnomerulius pinastri MD-312]
MVPEGSQSRQVFSSIGKPRPGFDGPDADTLRMPLNHTTPTTSSMLICHSEPLEHSCRGLRTCVSSDDPYAPHSIKRLRLVRPSSGLSRPTKLHLLDSRPSSSQPCPDWCIALSLAFTNASFPSISSPELHLTYGSHHPCRVSAYYRIRNHRLCASGYRSRSLSPPSFHPRCLIVLRDVGPGPFVLAFRVFDNLRKDLESHMYGLRVYDNPSVICYQLT